MPDENRDGALWITAYTQALGTDARRGPGGFRKQDWRPPKGPMLLRLLEAAKQKVLQLPGLPLEETLKRYDALLREALAADREGREPKIDAQELLRLIVLQGTPPGPPAPVRPAEYDFPDFLTLVNPISGSGYAMRYVAIERVENERPVAADEGWSNIKIVDRSLVCQVSDAYCFIRPYVFLDRSATPEVTDALSRGYLTCMVDGEYAIDLGPIAEHLAYPDGIGYRGMAFRLRYNSQACLYRAHSWRPEDNSYEPSSFLGFMLPNATTLSIMLTFDRIGKACRLFAGAVLAKYTTRR